MNAPVTRADATALSRLIGVQRVRLGLATVGEPHAVIPQGGGRGGAVAAACLTALGFPPVEAIAAVSKRYLGRCAPPLIQAPLR
jgi:hypothetical protein